MSPYYIKSLQPIVLESIKTTLVSHPDSPLQKLQDEELLQELQKHSCISLSPDSPDTDNQAQVIQVGSVETAISLIQHGLGYARLPLFLFKMN